MGGQEISLILLRLVLKVVRAGASVLAASCFPTKLKHLLWRPATDKIPNS